MAFTQITVSLRGVGGGGLFKKKKEAAEPNVLLCQKNSWKDLNRSIRVLKCIYAWNTVSV